MNTENAGGRPRVKGARKYFAFKAEENISYCQLPGCDSKQKGDHNGNLEKHLERFHPFEYTRICEEKEESLNHQKRKRSKSAQVVMTAERVKELFTRVVTVHGRPFAMLDDEAFKEVITGLLEAANLADECTISAATTRSWVVAKAREMRSVIGDELKGKLISLKVDAATRHDRGFIGINIQFIEDGVIHVRTLGVVELFHKHSADYLKETITKTLEKFGIDVASIYSFTSDNGANMVKVGKLFLEEQSQSAGGGDSDGDQDGEDEMSLLEEEPLGIDQSQFCTLCSSSGALISNLRCAAHTLQLSVEEALTKEKNSKKTLAKARTVAKALRTQTIRHELNCSQPGARKPKLDVPTRWHSTADMLESMIEYKDFCRKFSKKFKALELSDKEWQYIEDYLKSLMPAKIATKRLQDEQLTLGSFFGAWLDCKLQTEDIKTPLAAELVAAMKRREKQLFENDAFLASVYLDPRFLRLLSTEHRSTAVEKLEKVWRIIEEQNNKSTNSSHQSSPQSELTRCPRTAKQGSSDVRQSRASDQLRRMMNQVAAECVNPPVLSNIKRQLEEFPGTAGTLDLDDDILRYWESKKVAMPQLYQLATIVHAAPATQVTVERLFSGMRYIFADLRANLTPQILDDIMIVRCNSQNKTRAEKILGKPTERRQRRRTEGHPSISACPSPTTPSDEEIRTSFEAMTNSPDDLQLDNIRSTETPTSSTIPYDRY